MGSEKVYNFDHYNENEESDTEEEIEDHDDEPNLIQYYSSLIVLSNAI